MKNIFTQLLKNGSLIMLIIALLYIIFIRECKRPAPCPPEGYTLVLTKTWDSVLILANMPPVIKIKKEYIKGDTGYADRPLPVPVPDAKDTTISNFTDSLINDKINAWVDFRLRGELLDIRWRYIPITTNITLEKTVYMPKIVDRPVPVTKNGYYLSGLLGGRANYPIMFGASLDLVTKRNSIYGLQYQRMGSQNFYSFRLGAKIGLN